MQDRWAAPNVEFVSLRAQGNVSSTNDAIDANEAAGNAVHIEARAGGALQPTPSHTFQDQVCALAAE